MIRFKQQTDFVSDEIKRLTPVLGRDTAERLARAYLLGDETSRERIIEMIDIVKASLMADAELKDAAILEPPERTEGELRLGSILYGRKRMSDLRIKKEQLLTHIGIFGSSGYGKTNLSIALVKQLSEKSIPVIIFDFSKRNYRDLMKTDLSEQLHVYTVGRDAAPFRFNPLVPPSGTDTSQWMKEFASVFDHAYWLLGGGQHIILKALNKMYSKKRNPRLAELKEKLEKENSGTSRERNWLSTALRPLESLSIDGVREVFDCDQGTRPSDMIVPGRVTVLELDALSTNDRTFFIEIVLQWLRDFLLVHGKREELSAVVLIEEAHHILNREKLKKLGAETVMDTIFREIRELGVGIIYADQHPSLVSYPALGNTSMHIYLNLGLDSKYSSDIQDAASMLGLNDEKDYMRRLPVGHGFVLMRNSSFSYPFLAEFDKVEMSKGVVTDEDVRKAMKGKVIIKNDVQDEAPFPMQNMDEQGVRLLVAIGKGRGVTTSQLYRSVKMSGSTFNEHLHKLQKMGLVETRTVKKDRTRSKFCYLTRTGEATFSTYDRFTGVVQMDDAFSVFRRMGWKVREEDNHAILEKEGQKMHLHLLNDRNREKISASLAPNMHYLCASQDIKNVLLQSAARKKEGMIIFAATVDEFKETGGFEAVRL